MQAEGNRDNFAHNLSILTRCMAATSEDDQCCSDPRSVFMRFYALSERVYGHIATSGKVLPLPTTQYTSCHLQHGCSSQYEVKFTVI